MREEFRKYFEVALHTLKKGKEDFFFFKERSVTSVVHSMSHIPQTLRDFGPMQNYSTFNFESVVGMFEKPRMYSIN